MAQQLAVCKNHQSEKEMKALLNLVIILGLAYIVYSFTGVNNDNEQITRDYPVSDFNEVEFVGPYSIEISQGDKSSLTIKASELVQDKMEVGVRNGRLKIKIEDKYFARKKSIKVYLVVEDLNKLVISGAVNLETRNVIQTDDLKIEFEGAGQVNLDLDVDRIISDIDGVGSFWLQGNARYHKVNFSGVGSYDARNLICENTSVESDGVGNVEVFASENFIGKASGVGSVKYYGHPHEVTIDASGIGKVHSE